MLFPETASTSTFYTLDVHINLHYIRVTQKGYIHPAPLLLNSKFGATYKYPDSTMSATTTMLFTDYISHSMDHISHRVLQMTRIHIDERMESLIFLNRNK